MNIKVLTFLAIILMVSCIAITSASDVTFILRAGGSAVDKEIYVKPLNAETVWTIVSILPDGKSNPVPLDVGKYQVGVTDGNGGQPEQQTFTLKEAEHKVVSLLGHAVASHGKPTDPIPKYDMCRVKTKIEKFGKINEGYQTLLFQMENTGDIHPAYETITLTEKYKMFFPYELPAQLTCYMTQTREWTKTFTVSGVYFYEWEVPYHPGHVEYTFTKTTTC